MKITRLGSNKDINEEVGIVDIEITSDSGEPVLFRLHERFGALKIHKSCGEAINIKPHVTNEIEVS